MDCGSKPFVVEVGVHRQELCATVSVISCGSQCRKFCASLGQDILFAIDFCDDGFYSVVNFGQVVGNLHDSMHTNNAAQRSRSAARGFMRVRCDALLGDDAALAAV
jgi:hypothetical protein